MQYELFGGMPTRPVSLPAVGTVCARCLWQMVNQGWCDNHRLGEYGIANASRRMIDLREKYGWAIVTQTKQSPRLDGVTVPIKEYRVEPLWLNELVGEDETFKERLLLWSRAQNDYEQRHKAGGDA